MSEIDPVQIGRLISSVETLSRNVKELNKRIDDHDALINKGKGIFYFICFLLGAGYLTIESLFGG